MGNLERFRKPGVETSDTGELPVRKRDAFVTIEPLRGTLLHFSALQDGSQRDAVLISEKEVFLPAGAVAAVNLDDETEILLKHLKRRGRHEFGLVRVFLGDSIRHVTENGADFYFMDKGTGLYFPKRYGTQEAEGVTFHTRFVK